MESPRSTKSRTLKSLLDPIDDDLMFPMDDIGSLSNVDESATPTSLFEVHQAQRSLQALRDTS